MALFTKFQKANQKLTGSWFFKLSFLALVVLLCLGSVFLLMPNNNFDSVLSALEDSFSVTTQKKSVSAEELQDLEMEFEVILKDVYSKPRKTISALEEFENLPELLNNRKNYILMRLYDVINEPALAFVSANQISKKYLPKYSLFKKVQIATQIGLEAVVVDELEYLTKKFPSEAKFEYELAKSYSRQSMFAEAQKHFDLIQKVFKDSEYAIGANYYLANLTDDKELAKSRLKNYLQKSPSGSLSALAADRLIQISNADDLSIKTLANTLALSYHSQENYKKALQYFNPELDQPQFFLKAYAESLYKTNNKTKAIEALVKYIPRLNFKETSSELIEYMVKICSKYQALANLRLLKDKVLDEVKDKVLWEIAKKTDAKEDYQALYNEFPNSFYAAESMARVFWKDIKDKNYDEALSLAQIHWDSYPYALSHPYVAFWAAKIQQKLDKEEQAKSSFKKLIAEHPHSFYAYRSKQILEGEKNWYLMPASNFFVGFPSWNWPRVYTDKEITAKYDKDVLELIKIREFDFVLSLYDDAKLNKKFKMFLQANAQEHMKAIRTAYFSLKHQDKPDHNDLYFQYAFPLAYADLIYDNSGKNKKVDPLLVHALIRQESFYQEDIESKVGAVGLMQLMPYTAKVVARRLNLRPPRKYDLMHADINIKLGVNYMEEVFGQFENNMINAIASYNAGPVAVKKWMNLYQEADKDYYIESIPYEETRNYVKQVLANYWIYRELYS